MAVFRESSGDSGRASEDRRRHRQLVEQSIKKNIGQIIAEESIIGQSGQKKIKIPIKSLKEYQFIYGKNQPGVGTGSGQEQRGDVYRQGLGEKGGAGNQGAGNEAGEDIYETEITLEELIGYLFDDLDLPFMERKKLAEIETRTEKKLRGYRQKGPPPRLAKKQAVIEKIKRRQGMLRQDPVPTNPENASDTKCFPHAHDQRRLQERTPFREEDLRYRRVRESRFPESNAVAICIMDTSGSMDQTKKYLARSFYFLLYQFLRLKYLQVELVFIAHTTQAMEVDENEFFHKGESGGTYISSGYEKALRIIGERYPPERFNIYVFHCSDGDNWEEDNEKAVSLARQLCQISNLVGYVEIMTNSSAIRHLYQQKIPEKNLALVSISGREDIWPALRDLLSREDESPVHY
ncbi:MAG: YeaH/YhbH family protein [Firmicutes bacterium]|nr:YeaH/YhbH family protein [Bacillota bacterium]